MEHAMNIDDALSAVLERAAEITSAFSDGKFPEHECFEDGVQELVANILKIDFSLFHGGALPKRWLRVLRKGDRVRTLKSRGRTDWVPGSRESCQWGAGGIVLKMKTGHGLCYEVQHDDGRKAWYDYDEVKRA
jgi:hypothetical protein